MSPQVNKPVEGTKLVLIALGMALLAVLVTFVWVQQIKAGHQAKTMQVYLLTRDVHRNDAIIANDFEPQDVPKDGPIGDAFRKMNAADKDTIDNNCNSNKHWGQSASQGQLVTITLFNPEARVGIPPPDEDKAHMAIQVTDTKSPGDIRQGDYVELRRPFRGRGGVIEVVKVIEKVKIIQLGSEWTGEDAGRTSHPPSYRSATLEVALEDVPLLDAICKAMEGEFEIIYINPEQPGSMRVTKDAKDALEHRIGRGPALHDNP